MDQPPHAARSPSPGGKWTQVWRSPGGCLLVCGGIALLSCARSGTVTPIGWDLTAFLGVALVLPALVNAVGGTAAYAEAVRDGPAWLPPVALVWLCACILGPFVGFALTSTTLWPPTPSSWHGQYEARVLLNIALPVGLAVPLALSLAFSRARWVSVPCILFLTVLPIASAWNSMRDLRTGALWVRRQRDCAAQPANGSCTPWVHSLLLPHTRCVLRSLPEGAPVGPASLSVPQALVAEKLDYETTRRGNYRVTLKFTDGRQQQTVVEAGTKSYRGADWRKVYSEAFYVSGPLSQTEANDLLADADDWVFGGWCTEQNGGNTHVYFQASVPAGASPADLHHAISLVSGAADVMEKKVLGTDTN